MSRITDEDILKDEKLNKALLKELVDLCKNSELKSHSIPVGVILTKERFSVENRFLTVSFKPIRRNIAAFFKVPLFSSHISF